MSRLIRNIFGILVMVLYSLSSYGQHRVLVPVQPYSQLGRPGQRFNQRPLQQNGGARVNGRRRIQAVKEGFISQRLDLTQAEAKAFWPVYRKYTEELTAVKILKKINNSSATADGAKQVDQDLQYEMELVNIKKRYRDQFYKILPPEKVSILYKSEREFNDEALRILSEGGVRAGD